tara:strand:- start:45 stop:242 length:198 start_codon:yes stop_codon:yes gene_type:complete
MQNYSIIDKIIAFEQGELEAQEILELFSNLIKSGMAWTLQGSYGRTAERLIERKIINKDGDILNL